MVKSQAQRAHEYRERKKSKLKQKWLEMEAERVAKYYIKSADLSEENLKLRQKKVKKQVQRHRTRKSENFFASSEVTAALPASNHLNGPQKRGRKRVSHSLYRAKKHIKILEEEIARLKKKQKNLAKRYERLSKSEQKCSKQVAREETPIKKARDDMKDAGLTPRKAPAVYRKLVFHHSLLKQINRSIPDKTITKISIEKVVSGCITRKYRMLRYLGRETDLNRNQLYKTNKPFKKTRLAQQRFHIRTKVIDFLNRDDNSQMLAGKRDFKSVKKEKTQKRVLTDYLRNLHLKFLSENPNICVSLATFCKLRPTNISLLSFMRRKTCLCIYHQNMALKLASFMNTSKPNPDHFFTEHDDETIMSLIKSSEKQQFTFSMWKRVEVADNKKKTICVKKTKTKEEFIDLMSKAIISFRAHMNRVATQFRQIRKLKTELPDNHVVVQMDFSENYKCQSMDEVQSAYWCQSQVSLHPIVVYMRQENGNLRHKSYVYISDDLNHNTSSVYTILRKFVPELLIVKPDLNYIHYVTDGPTSQYRNKSMFHIIGNHAGLFNNVNASWHYLEVGHGKGPCDAIGGTVKRNADEEVKIEKTIIQSADDFFAWAKEHENNTVCYRSYTSEEVENSKRELESTKTSPIKGTLAIHAVVCISPGVIKTRETTCVCDKCFANGKMILGCDGWTEHDVGSIGENDIDTGFQSFPDQPETVDTIIQDDWVAVNYEGHPYIGKVISVNDHVSNKYFVRFLAKSSHKKRNVFEWPKEKDEIYVDYSSIICKIRHQY